MIGNEATGLIAAVMFRPAGVRQACGKALAAVRGGLCGTASRLRKSKNWRVQMSAGSGGEGQTVSFDEFKRLDLRIARVLEARPHPNADKLILLQIDVGGGEQKQIIAGLRQWYKPEELVGKLIVVVNNLEPAMLRGEESNGMLLAATCGDQVIVLVPEKPCEPGSKVS
jgi:methionyl-tRNA synthetase